MTDERAGSLARSRGCSGTSSSGGGLSSSGGSTDAGGSSSGEPASSSKVTVDLRYAGEQVFDGLDMKARCHYGANMNMLEFDLFDDRIGNSTNILQLLLTTDPQLETRPRPYAFEIEQAGGPGFMLQAGRDLDGPDRLGFSLYEGGVVFQEFNDSKTVLTIAGRGGVAADINDPDRWQEVTGTITVENQDISMQGVEDEAALKY